MSTEYDAAMEVKSAIDNLSQDVEAALLTMLPDLRDRFAIAALQALIGRYPNASLGAGSGAGDGPVPCKREAIIAGICATAYIYADAMMKARRPASDQ